MRILEKELSVGCGGSSVQGGGGSGGETVGYMGLKLEDESELETGNH